MGYRRNLRRINTSPVTGQEKRRRTPKAKLASKSAVIKSKAPNTATKRTAKKGPNDVGPGTRLGTFEEIPITISDDDDEDLTADEDDTYSLLLPSTSTSSPHPLPDLSRFRYTSSVSSPTPPLRSMYSPFNDICTPTGFILRRSSPPPSVQLPIRESRERQQTMEAVVRPTTIRDARTSKAFCRVKEDTPGPYKYRSRKTSSSNTTLLSNVAKSSKAPSLVRRGDIDGDAGNSDIMELTLADIPEFDLRSKVAQLMAVAPAIPVRDLYCLIIDSDGQFPIARERAIRASEAPPICQSVRPPASPSSAQSTPIVASFMQDSDDEIMVKIDPNDPAFEWDTDAPEPEPVEEHRRPTQESKARLSDPKPMPDAKHIKATSKKKMAKPAVRSSKSGAKSRPSVIARRTIGAPNPSKRTRDNSINRDFLVPDDVLFFDSDVSFSDEDSEHGDTNSSRNDIEMECFGDKYDLNIDMRPQDVFNAGLLRKKGTSS